MAQNWTRSHEQEVWVGFNQLSVGINTVEINMEKLVEKKTNNNNNNNNARTELPHT